MKTVHLIIPVLLLAATGCNGFFDGFLDPFTANSNWCNQAGTNADVEGRWSITGEVTKVCDNSQFNGAYAISSSNISIAQTESSTEEVDEIEPTSNLNGFSLYGTVEGSCLEFETTESSTDGDIRYTFEGVVDNDEVTGELTLDEPNCTGSGTFRITID